MSKKYVVKLTADERTELEGLIRKGKAARWKLQRAQAILAFDQGEGGLAWPDSRIADAYGCTTRSLENWRRQAVEQGPLSLAVGGIRPQPRRGAGGPTDEVSLFRSAAWLCALVAAAVGRAAGGIASGGLDIA